MSTTFEEDSRSPDTPVESPINREDMPINQMLLMDAMNIDIGVLLAEDDLAEDDLDPDDLAMPELEDDDDDDDDQGADTDEEGLRERWGLDHPHLLRLWRSFASTDKYKKTIVTFLLFHEAQPKCTEADLIENMVAYFEHSYKKKTDVPEVSAEALLNIKLQASTTLRGWLGIFTKFLAYTERGVLKQKATIVTDLLTAWDKDHTTKQSATYKKDQMGEQQYSLYYTMYYTNQHSISISNPFYLQLPSLRWQTPPRSCWPRPTTQCVWRWQRVEQRATPSRSETSPACRTAMATPPTTSTSSAPRSRPRPPPIQALGETCAAAKLASFLNSFCGNSK
jgi:hypothetical protein